MTDILCEMINASSTVLRALVEIAPDAMLVVDAEGNILFVNQSCEQLFGFAREELVGAQLERLIPERFHSRHSSYRQAYARAPRTRPMGAGAELFGLRKDGTEFPVEISLSPIMTDEGVLVAAAIRDITDRKQVDLLRIALEEKETLLKEIHHRVKNNLQVISSLLNLQSSRITDPESRALFAESQARVRAIALLHEKLYRSGDLARVDMQPYLLDLVAEIRHTRGALPGLELTVDVDAEGVRLDIDTAVPCGLVTNELVTNALKHAFVGRTGVGRVEVRMSQSNGGVTLTIRDNGQGSTEMGASAAAHETLGLRLVRSLARQLAARLEVTSDSSGTMCQLEFDPTQGR